NRLPYDLIFFFSSRRRHTRWPRDWSSDVCSSDLEEVRDVVHLIFETFDRVGTKQGLLNELARNKVQIGVRLRTGSNIGQLVWRRSEERRVGKECRSRWWAYDEKKKKDGGYRS